MMSGIKLMGNGMIIHILTTLIIAAGLALPASAKENKGRAIAKKSIEINQGFGGQTSTMVMKIKEKNGEIVTRIMSMISKEQDGGQKNLLVIDKPADVSGTKLLTWSYTGTKLQWLYLPSFKKIKKVAGTGRYGSFMGSEFSYEDLLTPSLDDYTYQYLSEKMVAKKKTWLVKRLPKNLENTQYSKHLVYFDQKTYQPLKIEFFNQKKKKFKIAYFVNFKGYRKKGQSKKFWLADTFSMKNVLTGRSSSITWKQRTLGADIDDDDLDKSSLED